MNKQTIPFWILWIGLIILNIFILAVSIASLCLLENEMDNVFTGKEEFLNSTKKHISYYNTMTGVETQTHNIPSWVYSTISFIESSYRKHGLEKGFLKENEYVKFDEELFYITLEKLCQEEEMKYCDVVKMNGSPELLFYLFDYYGDKLVKSITCKGYEEMLEKNPISFTIKEIKSVYNKHNVTEMMKNTNLPMTLSFGTYKRRYAVPCENSFGFVCDEDKTVSCMKKGGKCQIFTFNPYSNAGMYDYKGDLHFHTKHSVLVVGWNDEKRYDRSYGYEFHNYFDGGFIIKNAYGYNHGHSLKFWLQQHSNKEEAQICPNVQSFDQWIPLDDDCISQHSYQECCKDIIKKGVNDYVNETITRLRCNPNKVGDYSGIFECDESRVYFIKAKKATFGPYGSGNTMDMIKLKDLNMFRITLLSFNEDMTDKQEVILQPTCPEMMEDMFMVETRYIDEVTQKNTEECGYGFIPYAVLEQYNQHFVVDSLHAPAFSMFDIEWNDQSYVQSQTEGWDYEPMKEATKVVKQTNFVGPHDLN